MVRRKKSWPFFVVLTIVVAASLALLAYVAYGEALRTYPKFQRDKLIAQGETLQTSIESMLRAGVPLRQIIGFDSLARRLIASDDSIDSISLMDSEGRRVFRSRGKQRAAPAGSSTRILPRPVKATRFFEDRWHYKAVLPLSSKIETLGYLVLSMPREVVRDAVDDRFAPLVPLAAVLLGAFGLLIVIAQRGDEAKLRPRLNFGYVLTFLSMGVAVVAAMVLLYADGVQGKTKALADALGQRIGQIYDLGLSLDDFEGLDKVLAAYHALNPEISEISLTVDGQVVMGAASAVTGSQWQSNPANYEYLIELSQPKGGEAELRLVVGIPTAIVAAEIARSVKNFAVLFVASALLAHLFLQSALAQRGAPSGGEGGSLGLDRPPDGQTLALIPPFFFLAVFVEGLNMSFLPRLLEDVSSHAGATEFTSSLLFMAYFLSFAIILLPAGSFAERHGPRALLVAGALAAAFGMVLMMGANTPEWVVIARVLCGAGQGALFIGVQSFILLHSPPGQRTRGAAIIVFGFNGGMISGSAIGALLVNYIGGAGVFLAAAFIAASIALYAGFVLSKVDPSRPQSCEESERTNFAKGLLQLIKDWGFIRTVLFVGLPAKAVLTGVAMFALPLVLSRAEVAQEDIGLMIMLYAGAVLLASRFAAGVVDRLGHTSRILFIGSGVSAIALLIIAFGNRELLEASFDLTYLGWSATIFGTLLLGLAHGLINAPVVTHVANSKAALALGPGAATSIYRLAERFGHVAGPLLVGQAMLLSNQDPIAIGYVGLGVGLAALLFRLGRQEAEVSAPVLTERTT